MSSPHKKARTKVGASIPLVKQLFDIIDESEFRMVDIADRSGVHFRTLANWRTGRFCVKLFNFQAVAESLGYEVILRKKDSSK